MHGTQCVLTVHHMCMICVIGMFIIFLRPGIGLVMIGFTDVFRLCNDLPSHFEVGSEGH